MEECVHKKRISVILHGATEDRGQKTQNVPRGRGGPRILKGNGARLSLHDTARSRHKKRSVIDTNGPNTRDPKQEWVSIISVHL